jgi:hypothetical protein
MRDRDESKVANHVVVKMIDELHAENQRLTKWLRFIAYGDHDAAAVDKATRGLRGDPLPNHSHRPPEAS